MLTKRTRVYVRPTATIKRINIYQYVFIEHIQRISYNSVPVYHMYMYMYMYTQPDINDHRLMTFRRTAPPKENGRAKERRNLVTHWPMALTSLKRKAYRKVEI